MYTLWSSASTGFSTNGLLIYVKATQEGGTRFRQKGRGHEQEGTDKGSGGWTEDYQRWKTTTMASLYECLRHLHFVSSLSLCLVFVLWFFFVAVPVCR